MSESLKFLRADLAKLAAYKPHPGGVSHQPLDLLDTNESPLDLPQELKAKLSNLYQDSLEANRYPDGSHAQLKLAIAEYVRESAAELTESITPNYVSVGNGSDELIRSLLIATCLGGNGSILVAKPTFSMYAILAQTLGISVQTVDRQEDNFAIDLEQAQAAITNKQISAPVKVVFVVHPNSPTGNCLNSQEIEWLKSLPQDILVVVDEAYFEFSQLSLVAEVLQRPNWIILRTFSKAFRLAAHRVGYAIADPGLITALEKVRLPYNLPAFSQSAALLALQNRQSLLPLVAETIVQRDLVWQELNSHFAGELQLWRSQANFLYLRLANVENQDESLALLVSKLKEKGTLVRHTGGGIRITVGTKSENQRTLKNLQTCLATSS